MKKTKIIGLKNIKYELSRLKDLPHIMFTGPRGSGKTTMARFIAETRKRKLIFLTGNTLKKNELLNVFINLEGNEVILIDEIHRLRPEVEELLYQPMEDKKLPIKDATGTYQEFPLPKFMLIGTTTKTYMISKPLMSRFQITYNIPHYNMRELARIIKDRYDNINVRSALRIAKNTVTPREAINLAWRVLSLGKNIQENLEFIGYKYGLSKTERFYLKIIHNLGTASLNSLCSALQLDKEEIKYIEDSLIRKKLVLISPKGRKLTVKGILKVKEIRGK